MRNANNDLELTCDAPSNPGRDQLLVNDYRQLPYETHADNYCLVIGIQTPAGYSNIQLAKRSVAKLAEHLLYMLTTWPEDPIATG